MGIDTSLYPDIDSLRSGKESIKDAADKEPLLASSSQTEAGCLSSAYQKLCYTLYLPFAWRDAVVTDYFDAVDALQSLLNHYRTAEMITDHSATKISGAVKAVANFDSLSLDDKIEQIKSVAHPEQYTTALKNYQKAKRWYGFLEGYLKWSYPIATFGLYAFSGAKSSYEAFNHTPANFHNLDAHLGGALGGCSVFSLITAYLCYRNYGVTIEQYLLRVNKQVQFKKKIDNLRESNATLTDKEISDMLIAVEVSKIDSTANLTAEKDATTEAQKQLWAKARVQAGAPVEISNMHMAGYMSGATLKTIASVSSLYGIPYTLLAGVSTAAAASIGGVLIAAFVIGIYITQENWCISRKLKEEEQNAKQASGEQVEFRHTVRMEGINESCGKKLLFNGTVLFYAATLAGWYYQSFAGVPNTFDSNQPTTTLTRLPSNQAGFGYTWDVVGFVLFLGLAFAGYKGGRESILECNELLFGEHIPTREPETKDGVLEERYLPLNQRTYTAGQKTNLAFGLISAAYKSYVTTMGWYLLLANPMGAAAAGTLAAIFAFYPNMAMQTGTLTRDKALKQPAELSEVKVDEASTLTGDSKPPGYGSTAKKIG